MMKKQIYVLGLITLLVFPIPTFVVLYFFENTLPITVLELENFNVKPILYGLIIGLAYAGISLLFMQAKVFEKLPSRIENIVKQMNLSVIDCIFLSICAGVGEEILFRSGFQFYFGPIITSIFFVAIHGYLNPMNWRMSLYGLIILPFIFIIAYGFIEYGLWFGVIAHFSYDLVLFLIISQRKEAPQKNVWNDWEMLDENDDERYDTPSNFNVPLPPDNNSNEINS